MSSVVDELVVALGVDINTGSFEQIRRMSDGLVKITESAVKMGAGVTAAVTGWLYAIDKADSYGATLYKTSRSLNESSTAIQQFGYAIQQTGGNAEEAIGMFQKVSNLFANIVPGQKNEPLFMLFGNQDYEKLINATDPQRIMAISNAFQKLSTTQQFQWGKYSGFSDSEIRLFQQKPEMLQKHLKDALTSGQILPDNIIQKNFEGERSLKNIWSTLKELSGELAAEFTPELEKSQTALSHWAETLKQGGPEADRFKEIAEGLAIALGGLAAAKMITSIWSLGTAITGLMTSMTAFALSPGGVLLMAIAGAGLTGYEIYQHWDDLKDLAQKIEDDIHGRTSGETKSQREAARNDPNLKNRLGYGEGGWIDVPDQESWRDTAKHAGTWANSYLSKPGHDKKASSIMDMLIHAGFSKEAAAALTATWDDGESGLNPDQHERGGGKGYGIAQWTSKDRKQALFDFAAERHMPVSDLKTQVQFAIHEIMTNPKYAKLRGSGSLEEMLHAAVYDYEAPANKGAEYGRVLGTARKYYKTQSGGGSGDTTNNNSVTQNIYGSDARETADRAHKKLVPYLQQTFPGNVATVAA